jgi:hypothetical protein
MGELMDAARIDLLLRELATRLVGIKAPAGIRIVGGAAIALMNPDREATFDIDALLLPRDPILAVANQMSGVQGLPANWINTAVVAYVPPVGAEDWVELLTFQEVRVSIGSPEMLLSMKLLANRGRRDSTDIEFLLEECGVTSLEQAQVIFERYHAQDVISDAANERIGNWLARNDEIQGV